MKIIIGIIGAILVIVGVIWFLQGINILPGSFMTGQIQWAIYGIISFVVGVSMLVFAIRRKPSQ